MRVIETPDWTRVAARGGPRACRRWLDGARAARLSAAPAGGSASGTLPAPLAARRGVPLRDRSLQSGSRSHSGPTGAGLPAAAVAKQLAETGVADAPGDAG